MFNPLIILIGIIYAPIAAFMAFLITYGEYKRHFKDKRKSIQMAIETASVTFIFFILLSVIICWLLGKFLK